uniref:non-specific serine/threonine protein kinase n=1 Tax=Spongospora subterranea TaxID=70186 RepID=A0A0H5RC67_9EUKA|eukprot:CRZ11202.1 hypothetical protein [Spongospora subterranea]
METRAVISLDSHQKANPLASYDPVLLAQGAEARVWKGVYQGQQVIIKERFTKLYRHSDLDEKLTKRRTKSEAKCLTRCFESGKCFVPSVVHVDKRCARLFIEYIDAPTVKSFLSTLSTRDALADLARQLGCAIAALHNLNVIHGDLTTSNILRRADGNLVLIDFGLSFISSLVEDKAVDLYVLERALLSTHPEFDNIFEMGLDSYCTECTDADNVLTRLETVRLRGRKRSMIG